jgi:hypothetical protein
MIFQKRAFLLAALCHIMPHGVNAISCGNPLTSECRGDTDIHFDKGASDAIKDQAEVWKKYEACTSLSSSLTLPKAPLTVPSSCLSMACSSPMEVPTPNFLGLGFSTSLLTSRDFIGTGFTSSHRRLKTFALKLSPKAF